MVTLYPVLIDLPNVDDLLRETLILRLVVAEMKACLGIFVFQSSPKQAMQGRNLRQVTEKILRLLSCFYSFPVFGSLYLYSAS